MRIPIGLRSLAAAAENAPLGKKLERWGRAAFALAAQPLIASRKIGSRYDESASGARYLNTPRLIADSTGATVWRNDNAEPFGDSVADENPGGLGAFPFDLGFAGQVRDRETGLFYNYLRDCYDPATGRFCEPDPAGTVFFGDMAVRSLAGLGLMQPRVADGLYSDTAHYNNLYLYAKASPLKYTDRFGLVAVPAEAASIISGSPAGSTSVSGGQSSSSGTMMCAANERSACYEMCNVIRDAKIFACAGEPGCVAAANRWWTFCRARCAASY